MIEILYSTLISTISNNTTLFPVIEGRVFTAPLDLPSVPKYPIVMLTPVGGIPNKEGYPVNTYIIDMKYISTISLAQCYSIYEQIHGIINKKTFISADKLTTFEVVPDSLPINASQVVSGKLYYILSSIWELKAIGA